MATAALEQEHSDLAEEASALFKHMDVLIIQDGGCAPGYNPVTAFLAAHLERFQRRCYAAFEGFKSVVDNNDTDYRRTIYKRSLYKQEEHIPGVLNISTLCDASGARFRRERYSQFAEKENVEKAAQNIIQRHVNIVVAIGGNGTFMGIRDLDTLLPPNIQTFFIPVTVDSDISNTECIGQHTGVEEGARKIACYAADARTHKRIYFVEMMGASCGFHALHSCIGGRAHLAVLPGMDIDLQRTIELLNRKEAAVVVVAEGYKRDQRPKNVNAAEFFLSELRSTGKQILRKVVCEAFSRDIRGARPNSQDITLAQIMAYCTARYINEGRSAVMPAINGYQDYPLPFEAVTTDNAVESNLAKVANRLFLDTPAV